MNKKLIFWLIILLIIFAFLYSISNILFPFIFGILVAYFFDPVVCKLEKNGTNRAVASGLIIAIFMASVILIVTLTAPIIAKQGQDLAVAIPEYYEKIKTDVIPDLEKRIYKIAPEIAEQAKIEAQKQTDFTHVKEKVAKYAGKLLSSGAWLFNIISLLLITPIVSFYILRDWGNFIHKADDLLPRQYESTIKEQICKIDRTVSAFLRGQLNVCLILGTYFAIALTIAGLNFGLLLGFVAGMLCFVPFVGTMLGFLIAIIVAFFQFDGDLVQMGIIAAIFGLGQFVEGNFLTPKIVGDKIGVHPAWLIFGMLAGASLLGITGVILAVPLTAIINVLIQFAIEEYEKSEYYGKKDAPKKHKNKIKQKA
jgi:predicted PurR-regulated permease PerM